MQVRYSLYRSCDTIHGGRDKSCRRDYRFGFLFYHWLRLAFVSLSPMGSLLDLAVVLDLVVIRVSGVNTCVKSCGAAGQCQVGGVRSDDGFVFCQSAVYPTVLNSPKRHWGQTCCAIYSVTETKMGQNPKPQITDMLQQFWLRCSNVEVSLHPQRVHLLRLSPSTTPRYVVT